jgi:hypothetical protein
MLIKGERGMFPINTELSRETKKKRENKGNKRKGEY